MGYLTSIKTALLIFPLISLLFTIPFIIHQYHKYGSINKYRIFIVYSFILYMITIYFLVILPLPDKDSLVESKDMVRLIPFSFIRDFLDKSTFVLTNPKTYLGALKEPCFYTVIFNLFMTIPFGMYLRYYYKCSLKKTATISFLLSLFFEITQLTGLYFIYDYPYRIFDVDDLIINTIGGIIGYFIMGVFSNYLPSREKIDRDSLEMGRQVSGLRRITIFFFDLLIYIIITLILSFIYKYNNIKYITFILYYIIIPYILGERTLGSYFLNVKIEYKSNRLINNIFRFIFIFLYYFLFPYIFLLFTYSFINYLKQSSYIAIYFQVINIVIIISFYLLNFFTILIKRKIYYDKIFNSKFISTINIK